MGKELLPASIPVKAWPSVRSWGGHVRWGRVAVVGDPEDPSVGEPLPSTGRC